MSWMITVVAIIAGVLCSLFYFGGLWLTLRKIAEHELSYGWALASFIVRMSFVMGIFYLLLIQHWAYLGIALAAFLIVRQVLMARLGKPEQVPAD